LSTIKSFDESPTPPEDLNASQIPVNNDSQDSDEEEVKEMIAGLK